MTTWWRAFRDPHPQQMPPTPTANTEIDALIDAAFQESARADAESAALPTVVGIGFTAFSAGCASAIVVPLRGPAQWLSVAALAGVCVVAEFLLLALRPRLGNGLAGREILRHLVPIFTSPDVLAAELSAELDACRMLIQLSCIAWRKYLLIRWSVHLLVAIVPLVALAVSVALLMRLPSRLG